MYIERKFGQPYQAEMKRLSKEFLVGKKKSQESFLRSVLPNEDAGQICICMLNNTKEI